MKIDLLFFNEKYVNENVSQHGLFSKLYYVPNYYFLLLVAIKFSFCRRSSVITFFDTSLEWFMVSNKTSDEILFSEFEMFKIRSIAFIVHSAIFNTPKINVINGTISRFCDMQHL